ncbi:potassium transporter KtrB [[Mycoplasma] phocae]|uniref:Potassium transporter KtrB n=1 Tax=[Mycoplasma] phocae TaxID=142651 RepID=A0A2Z5IQF8_9BACT|nr:potassium transporter TrkG [[Mycoplasma] phocae]AXE60807.1 potassium transporter KtrB [[Mycoplasma] phocae]
MTRKKSKIRHGNIIFRFLRKIGTIRYIFLIYVLFTLFMSILLYWNMSHNFDENGNRIKINYLDALFVASSAFSDTGLTTVTISETFNEFGQAIIAFCIVVGGIGIFTFKVYLFQSILGFKSSIFNNQVSLTERGASNVSETKKMIKISISFLIIVTLMSSLIFTFMFYYNPSPYFNDAKASVTNNHIFNPYVKSAYNPYQNFSLSLRYGIFHAISSINNAGFDIIGDKSLQPYYHDFGLQIVTIIIFLIGGIGFPVIYDIWKKIISTNKNSPRHRFSLFTKFTLIAYVVTTVVGLTLTVIFETTAKDKDAFWNQSEYGSTWSKLFAIFFQTKSTRSAGFSTVNYFNFTQPTVLVHAILMFVGFSPVSTAGGIRNTTIAVIFLSILTTIRGKRNVHAFRRQIGKETLIKAINVFTIALFLAAIFTIVVFATIPNVAKTAHNENYTMLMVFFEICSAFGNSGLSIGITNSISIVGKLSLIFVMIMGQFGIPQVIKIWGRNKSTPEQYQYIYEDVSIG